MKVYKIKGIFFLFLDKLDFEIITTLSNSNLNVNYLILITLYNYLYYFPDQNI